MNKHESWVKWKSAVSQVFNWIPLLWNCWQLNAVLVPCRIWTFTALIQCSIHSRCIISYFIGISCTLFTFNLSALVNPSLSTSLNCFTHLIGCTAARHQCWSLRRLLEATLGQVWATIAWFVVIARKQFSKRQHLYQYLSPIPITNTYHQYL